MQKDSEPSGIPPLDSLFIIIEFDMKNAFFKFAVMYNADVFDGNPLKRKNACDNCNSTCFIFKIKKDFINAVL